MLAIMYNISGVNIKGGVCVYDAINMATVER